LRRLLATVPILTLVTGLRAQSLDRAEQRLRAIVAQHLPGTDATIVLRDECPAMSPTPGNARLLGVYDSARC